MTNASIPMIMFMTLIITCTLTAEEIMSTLPETPVSRVTPAEVKVMVAETGWWLCVPMEGAETVEVRYVPAPESATCPATGTPVPFSYVDGVLTLHSNDIPADRTCRPVMVRWPESRWTTDMQKFEEADRTTSPMTGGLLFTGSSTARMWNVATSFPDLTTLNRGFGGSQYWDVFQFAHRILGAHQPEHIVLYSGDNDINSGKSPEWVFADCALAVGKLRMLAPDSQIIILATKPSGSRWEQYPAMQQTNALMKDYATTLDKVSYLDLGTLLLNENGQPDPDCYLKDALHLSEEGYSRWNKALLEHLHNLQP